MGPCRICGQSRDYKKHPLNQAFTTPHYARTIKRVFQLPPSERGLRHASKPPAMLTPDDASTLRPCCALARMFIYRAVLWCNASSDCSFLGRRPWKSTELYRACLGTFWAQPNPASATALDAAGAGPSCGCRVFHRRADVGAHKRGTWFAWSHVRGPPHGGSLTGHPELAHIENFVHSHFTHPNTRGTPTLRRRGHSGHVGRSPCPHPDTLGSSFRLDRHRPSPGKGLVASSAAHGICFMGGLIHCWTLALERLGFIADCL